MVDKETVAIAVVLSVILSTVISFGVIMTVPQVQDLLRGIQGEIGPQGEQGIQGESGESIVGPQGEVGLQGPQGEIGSQGLRGLQGEPYSFEGEWHNIFDLKIEHVAIYELIDSGDIVPEAEGLSGRFIEVEGDFLRIRWKVKFESRYEDEWEVLPYPGYEWGSQLYLVMNLGSPGEYQINIVANDDWGDNYFFWGRGRNVLHISGSGIKYLEVSIEEFIPSTEE